MTKAVKPLFHLGRYQFLWYRRRAYLRWMWAIDLRLGLIALGPLGIEWD